MLVELLFVLFVPFVPSVAGNNLFSSLLQSLACLCVTVTLFSGYESPIEVQVF